MSSPVEDKRKYAMSIAFLIFLIVFTFYMIFRDVDFLSVLPQVIEANPIYVLAGFACMFGYICCEAFNIYHLTNTLGEKTGFASCLKYAFVGFYFSSITPSSSGGQPAQIYYMKKDKVNIGASSVGFVIMLAALQVVTLIVGGIMLFWKGNFVFSNMEGGSWILFVYGMAFYVGLILLLATAVYSPRLLEKAIVGCVNFLFKIKVIKNKDSATEKIHAVLKNYTDCAVYVKKNPLVLLKTMGVSLCQILFQFSVPFFVYMAFDQGGFGYFDILALQTILTICVSSLPLPGAVGASEASFITMFTVIFGAELVLPAMILNRAISFYIFLIVSACVTIAAHYITMKK